MTARTQRRAAERKTRKAETKKLRHQSQLVLAATQNSAAIAAEPLAVVPQPEHHSAQTISDSALAATAARLVSDKRLAANRANAQHSCGPTSALGKSISSQNNFRHGLTQTEGDLVLLKSESPSEFEQSLTNYQTEWSPQSETEHALVQRLATHQWLRRRALRLQKRFQDSEGFIFDIPQFNLYRRYEVQHERAFNKALSDLIRLQSLRQRERNGFESQARKQEKHEYQIRHLKHREKMHWFNELTAQARMTLQQAKLIGVVPLDTPLAAPPKEGILSAPVPNSRIE